MATKSSASSQQEKRRSGSGANITAELATELKAIAAMSDKEIEISDIPEKLDWSNAEVGKFYRPIKRLVSMRVDADVLDWFQRKGKRYTAIMNEALRSYIAAQEALTTKRRARPGMTPPASKKPSRKRA